MSEWWGELHIYLVDGVPKMLWDSQISKLAKEGSRVQRMGYGDHISTNSDGKPASD